MNPERFTRMGPCAWRCEPGGDMHVPAVIYADEALLRDMDDKVLQQVTNVARLPGIVQAAYAMPDAHWGYGFPIGGVAAFDPAQGGVVSAGGVGFDISCGVRALHTGLTVDDLMPVQARLADELFAAIPAGVGSTGGITLSEGEMEAMLAGGAEWAVGRGWGTREDLERTEQQGCAAGALPQAVSAQARHRQRREMGTLGSGNHYLEVQAVARVCDGALAKGFGLRRGDVVVSIHCGSRGLGHQIGTDYLRRMVFTAREHGISLPERELACAPLHSEVGEAYLGAMRGGSNCALANRQILTDLTRKVFARVLPRADLHLLYDVSHNTCTEEQHEVAGVRRTLFVHRKGATRAFGPGHPDLPPHLRPHGQPVLIGGSMGTASYVLAGTTASEGLAFSSACHGAGRRMSRTQAKRQWRGREVVEQLAEAGILIRSRSPRGVAEEAPGAYKDVAAVVEATEGAGLARRVVELRPLVCIKG